MKTLGEIAYAAFWGGSYTFATSGEQNKWEAVARAIVAAYDSGELLDSMPLDCCGADLPWSWIRPSMTHNEARCS